VVAGVGYYVINKLSDVQLPRDTGDFRIMSRRVIEDLRRLNETHGFLRGLVAYVGYKQAAIEYDRDERIHGRGNYNRFFGSLRIGLNGLISFSSRPLQIMSIAGGILAGFSFLLGAWYVFQKLVGFDLTPGLSTTVLVVTFFAGVQLLCLGLMGEYVGRIYDEVKRRPMYIIDKKLNF
jgi:dolichol-phosphate mannosyltransferase